MTSDTSAMVGPPRRRQREHRPDHERDEPADDRERRHGTLGQGVAGELRQQPRRAVARARATPTPGRREAAAPRLSSHSPESRAPKVSSGIADDAAHLAQPTGPHAEQRDGDEDQHGIGPRPDGEPEQHAGERRVAPRPRPHAGAREGHPEQVGRDERRRAPRPATARRARPRWAGRRDDATSHTMTSSSSVSSTDHSAKYHAARVVERAVAGTRLATAVSTSPVSGGCPVTGAPSPPWRYAARPALRFASR